MDGHLEHPRSRPVADAKARFSEFLDGALEDDPQIVTRRGIEYRRRRTVECLCPRSLDSRLQADFGSVIIQQPHYAPIAGIQFQNYGETSGDTRRASCNCAPRFSSVNDSFQRKTPAAERKSAIRS